MNLVGRTILAVLSLWHGLAAIQNFFDVLASTGVAARLRPLASKNFDLIAKVAEPVHLPKPAIAVLLTGAATMETAAAVSFVRGATAGENYELGFTLSLALFGSFFLIDDALDDYDLGAKHRAIFTLVAAGYAAARAAKS
jgi:hypothetical protein